jgi:hypothetical protein
LRCPPGYWRADDDESGACVKKPVVCIAIFPPPPGCPVYTPGSVNGTSEGNVTDSIGNATDATPSYIAPANLTQLDGSDGGDSGTNETIIPEPVACPEGEQPTEDGMSCEPIISEEPTTIECGEGEELVDGQCQPIPTEEDTITDEQISGNEGGGDEGADTTDEGGETKVETRVNEDPDPTP